MEEIKDEIHAEDEDKSKPVASQLIPGTSWCVVWTGDEKMFFFNPTSRLSIWERPDELEDNEKVDEIISKGPPKKQPDEVKSMYYYVTHFNEVQLFGHFVINVKIITSPSEMEWIMYFLPWFIIIFISSS